MKTLIYHLGLIFSIFLVKSIQAQPSQAFFVEIQEVLSQAQSFVEPSLEPHKILRQTFNIDSNLVLCQSLGSKKNFYLLDVAFNWQSLSTVELCPVRKNFVSKKLLKIYFKFGNSHQTSFLDIPSTEALALTFESYDTKLYSRYRDKNKIIELLSIEGLPFKMCSERPN